MGVVFRRPTLLRVWPQATQPGFFLYRHIAIPTNFRLCVSHLLQPLWNLTCPKEATPRVASLACLHAKVLRNEPCTCRHPHVAMPARIHSLSCFFSLSLQPPWLPRILSGLLQLRPSGLMEPGKPRIVARPSSFCGCIRKQHTPQEPSNLQDFSLISKETAP